MAEESFDLGVVLKEIRKRKNLSLAQAGIESGLSKSAIVRIERGDRHPGLQSLTSIAGAYGIRFVVDGEGVFIEDAP